MRIKREQLADKTAHIRARISQPEKLLLYDLAGEVPVGGHILEIGSAYGASAACLWAGSDKTVSLTLVDNFTYKNFGQTSAQLLNENLSKIGCVYKLVRGDSKVVTVPNKHYYLVHIDGNHGEDFVASDLLRFGLGAEIVVCHDYAVHAKTPAVTEQVDLFVKEHPEYGHAEAVDKYMVLRKDKK
jgi:hypothetical protein